MPPSTKVLAAAVVGLLALGGCSNSGRELRTPTATRPAAIASPKSGLFTFSSASLDALGRLPASFSIGDNPTPPALSWAGLPAGSTRIAVAAESVATDTTPSRLVWLVLNVDAALGGLTEGQLPAGAVLITPWNPTVAAGATAVRVRLFALAGPVDLVSQRAPDYLPTLEAKRLGVAEFTATFAAAVSR